MGIAVGAARHAARARASRQARRRRRPPAAGSGSTVVADRLGHRGRDEVGEPGAEGRVVDQERLGPLVGHRQGLPRDPVERRGQPEHPGAHQRGRARLGQRVVDQGEELRAGDGRGVRQVPDPPGGVRGAAQGHEGPRDVGHVGARVRRVQRPHPAQLPASRRPARSPAR